MNNFLQSGLNKIKILTICEEFLKDGEISHFLERVRLGLLKKL